MMQKFICSNLKLLSTFIQNLSSPSTLLHGADSPTKLKSATKYSTGELHSTNNAIYAQACAPRRRQAMVTFDLVGGVELKRATVQVSFRMEETVDLLRWLEYSGWLRRVGEQCAEYKQVGKVKQVY